ncbi:MAG: MBL fold metallo-hydrolase RNA specificity domain-containing protein [Thiohalorhabdus sp.]|uniref:MBL fold metallo-hydrolase RNA specificity domain-containing protein n=1 Tax=Thiohalorhabdus sp. TaxID=3094134 RepID=UPI00398099F5
MDIQFLGAAREVTGSCFLIRVGRRRLLVDCGLIQGAPEDEERNREPFPFAADRIDAVVLTHAHLDHSGRLPLLVQAGFHGPIYTHRASRDLCRIMLKDAGNLNEREAEAVNRKRARRRLEPVEPLYTVKEAQRAMRRFRALDYGETRRILPGVWLRLRDAGHILGSAIVELWLEEDGRRRKLVFSGDLGHRGSPILREPECVEEADLVVMESTYGDRLHRSWAATWQEMGAILQEARAEAGNILIPAFAVGRTQELLYAFGKHYREWGLDDWSVFLDSPMAIETTRVYTKHQEVYDREATQRSQRNGGNPFALPNLQMTRTPKQSMGINRIRSGAIIIAGSGMCTGGRIKHHLKHNLWRDAAHLVFVGYQARGTLGRRLVDGAREVELWGEPVKVGARVHTVGGFSAHADSDGLRRWYAAFSGSPAVVLVHGEEAPMETLGEKLAAERGREGVLRPQPEERLDLTDLPGRTGWSTGGIEGGGE